MICAVLAAGKTATPFCTVAPCTPGSPLAPAGSVVGTLSPTVRMGGCRRGQCLKGYGLCGRGANRGAVRLGNTGRKNKRSNKAFHNKTNPGARVTRTICNLDALVAGMPSNRCVLAPRTFPGVKTVDSNADQTYNPSMSEAPTNQLKNETSPYLLQHKDNPIAWMPWGDEAFRRARLEQKPIFLSVGYSTCHWCHVMAHESFEDSEVAAVLNKNFVCIKLDREERPDVDHIYMSALQTLSGGGGWPMSVWLTEEGKAFFAGTYFPKMRFCNSSVVSKTFDHGPR